MNKQTKTTEPTDPAPSASNTAAPATGTEGTKPAARAPATIGAEHMVVGKATSCLLG